MEIGSEKKPKDRKIKAKVDRCKKRMRGVANAFDHCCSLSMRTPALNRAHTDASYLQPVLLTKVSNEPSVT